MPWTMSYGWISDAAGPSSSQAPASAERQRTPSRSFSRGPSFATRLRPSLIGLTSSTSYRCRAATVLGKSSRASSTIGCQSAVAQRSFTRCAACSTSLRYARYSGIVSREALSRARKTTRERHSACSSSSASNTANPRTMFLEGSMRSTRSRSVRSPTSSASSAAAAAVASDLPSAASDSPSGPIDATNVGAVMSGPRISRTDAAYARAQRSQWNPQGTAAIERQICSATSVGRTRMEFGPQNDVCVKCATRTSPRRARSIPGTSASW